MSLTPPAEQPTASRLTLRAAAPWVYVAMTALIWVTRIRNIFDDADLDGSDRSRAMILPVLFLASAVLVGFATLRLADGTKSLVLLLVAASVTVVWFVRSIMIASGDHPVGFVLVHVWLAIVSILLAWFPWAAARPRPSGTAAFEGDEKEKVPNGMGS